MPRQRTDHSRITYVFPDDFPQRLERFKEESGLSWAELARRLGSYPKPRKEVARGRPPPPPGPGESNVPNKHPARAGAALLEVH